MTCLKQSSCDPAILCLLLDCLLVQILLSLCPLEEMRVGFRCLGDEHGELLQYLPADGRFLLQLRGSPTHTGACHHRIRTLSAVVRSLGIILFEA